MFLGRTNIAFQLIEQVYREALECFRPVHHFVRSKFVGLAEMKRASFSSHNGSLDLTWGMDRNLIDGRIAANGNCLARLHGFSGAGLAAAAQVAEHGMDKRRKTSANWPSRVGHTATFFIYPVDFKAQHGVFKALTWCNGK